MSDGPEQLLLVEPIIEQLLAPRRTTHDEDISTLIANAHELGRGHGYEAGLREGYEIAREHMIDRVAQQLAQRSGSPHDAGGPALREAVRRLKSRREDIDPGARALGHDTKTEGL